MSARAAGLDEQIVFNIPAQPLESALLRFSQQASVQLLTSSDELPSAQSNEVSGRLAVRVALATLLQGTGLTFSLVRDGTIAIRPAQAPSAGAAASAQASSLRLAQADATVRFDEPNADAKKQELEEVTVTIPEVLVVGSKILNMDIRRTEDDPQPYVIFERGTIADSGATNIENFLKSRLTMNTVGESNSQGQGAFGATSMINLRGLGTSQTLILVDGHRVMNPIAGASARQADLNGIPLSAVERIEVLPTTASGIYGGGATGGVVNVILRRDYSGAELQVGYENTFDADAAKRTFGLNAGFNLEGGNTTVLVAGSWSDQDHLLARDRDFVRRGRAAITANNPAFLLPPNAPPLGATPNIRSTSGDLVLKDGTALNSMFTSVPVGYAGTAGDNGAALVANAGRYNLNLADTAQVPASRRSIVVAPEVQSFTATIRRKFGPRVQMFVDMAAANDTGRFIDNAQATTFTLSPTVPSNPFQQTIQVTVPSAAADAERVAATYDRRVVGGVIVQLPAGWQAEADYVWHRTRNWSRDIPRLGSAGSAAVANGTLDLIRDTNAFPVDFAPFLIPGFQSLAQHFILRSATARLAGPIGLVLPAGRPVLSGLVEHRTESFGEGHQIGTTENLNITVPSRRQAVYSIYLEGRIPLVAAQNALPAVQQLEVQVAGRYDDYTIEGATSFTIDGSGTPVARNKTRTASTNPTVGLRWKPVDDVMLRASYGTGFLPPSVNQILPTTSVATQTFVDPRRGGGSVALPAGRVIGGGNPDLQPERSESRSVGLVITPRFAPRLRLSVDYTQIEKTDNIRLFPGGTQALINNESLFPTRITRGANQPGDLPGWPGPITAINAGLFNVAAAEIEAYDVALDYQAQSSRAGSFDFFAAATWQTHLRTQVLSTAPVVENIGVGSFNPLRFKGNAGLTWKYRQWNAGWIARYFDSYLVLADPTFALNQGNGGRVPRQIYHDAFASYRFNAVLRDTEVQFGIKNILNEEPPLDVVSDHFYSPFGDAQLASYYLSIKKVF